MTVSRTTMNFIASPELVTAFALAGRLSFNPLKDTLIGDDGKPFMLECRRSLHPRCRQKTSRGAVRLISRLQADAGQTIELNDRAANSERLQRLEPWPAWDGSDFLEMPVLLKTKGKTTTDHISPAGPWLRYRGHLDKFSDNMFMGATNAFTGTPRAGLSGAADQPFGKIARDYKSRGARWVVVGDFNYGEGSSREHAALSPRLLGGVAVIARSLRASRIQLENARIAGADISNLDDY